MTRTDACHCLLYFLLSKLSLRAQVVMRNLFVAVLVVVVTHERSESWPLTNTIQDMTAFLLKILEAIVVLAHCRKLDWIEAFPPPLLSVFVLGGRLSACSCQLSVLSLPSICGLAALLAGCVLTVVTVRHDWFPLTHFQRDHNVSFTEKSGSFFTSGWSHLVNAAV